MIPRAVLIMLIWALAVVLMLPGCSSLNAIQSGIARQGAAASDELLETSEWAICKAVSVGAWTRAYGSSKERAEAWRTLCSVKIEQTP